MLRLLIIWRLSRFLVRITIAALLALLVLAALRQLESKASLRPAQVGHAISELRRSLAPLIGNAQHALIRALQGHQR